MTDELAQLEARMREAERLWESGPRRFYEPGVPAGHVHGKAHQKISTKHATRYKNFGPLPVSAQLGAIKDKERYNTTTFRGHKVLDLGGGYYATPKGLPVIHDERSRRHFGEMFNASDD